MENNKGYVIGIDGGGTHFRMRATSISSGKILSSIDVSSLGYFSKDPEKSVIQLKEETKKLISIFNGKEEECKYIVCGISGLDSAEDKSLFESMLNEVFPYAKAEAMNDGELAFEAITGKRGILINSGTGSICVGRNGGEIKRVGGWPYTVYGDEGSGVWLSLKALRKIGEWFDKVIDESILINYLLSELKIHNVKEYLDFCLHFTLSDLSAIPPLVDKAALKCDNLAIELITAAYSESFKLADELARVLHFCECDTFKVGVWGSNILNSKLHLEGFVRLFKEKYPNADICIPCNSLIGYATEMAFQKYSPVGGLNEL